MSHTDEPTTFDQTIHTMMGLETSKRPTTSIKWLDEKRMTWSKVGNVLVSRNPGAP